MTQAIEKIQESILTISLDEEVLKVFANMPDSLKIEVLHYAQYLLNQDVKKIAMKSVEKKSLAGYVKGTFVLPLPDNFAQPFQSEMINL